MPSPVKAPRDPRPAFLSQCLCPPPENTGNPLKPDAYTPCGGPNDRVLGHTSRSIRFDANTTYIVMSNGVGVKEFHKPQQGWPAEYRINIKDFTQASSPPPLPH